MLPATLNFVPFVLFVAAAIARSPELPDRVARRRQSKPEQFLNHADTVNVSQFQYSSAAAGAVYASYPSVSTETAICIDCVGICLTGTIANQGSFTSVTGTFTVPTLNVSSSSNGTPLSVWVGIDGDTCDTAILQTGIDFTITDGSISYDGTPIARRFHFLTDLATAWYEWYPDYAYDFSGISFIAGDSVRLTVSASSTTTGTVTVENLSTNATVTQQLTSSYALCEENAEWLLEVYEESGESIPEFGIISIADAYASTGSGSIGPSGAVILDIEGEVSVTVSSSAVTIEYVG